MATLTGSKVERKTSDETVNSGGTGSTLQNDDDLVLAIGANETWYFEAMVLYNSGTTPDIKFAFTVPAGATLSWGVSAVSTGGTALRYGPIVASATAQSIGTSGADQEATIHGVVVNGANAGNLQLQWAQNASDAGDTKVLATSYLMGAREA